MISRNGIYLSSSQGRDYILKSEGRRTSRIKHGTTKQGREVERQCKAKHGTVYSSNPASVGGRGIIKDIRHIIQVAMDWQLCILWEPASPCPSWPLIFLLGKQDDNAEEAQCTSHRSMKCYSHMLNAGLVWEWVATWRRNKKQSPVREPGATLSNHKG